MLFADEVSTLADAAEAKRALELAEYRLGAELFNHVVV
jgi:hypothetical protein